MARNRRKKQNFVVPPCQACATCHFFKADGEVKLAAGNLAYFDGECTNENSPWDGLTRRHYEGNMCPDYCAADWHEPED